MTESTIRCPHCGAETPENMPIDACVWFWECPACRALVKPKPRDCCVFCSYGTIPCPPGNLPGAGEMFREAHSQGRDPQPGLALLRLAEGRPEAARSMIERVLMEPVTALDRAKLLPALVEIRVACGEIDAAAEGTSELETITTTYTAPALATRMPNLGRNRPAIRTRPDQALAV